MVGPLDLELSTYERERGRLENEHRGKFVLIRGERIAGIFDHFHAASEHAARRFRRESYLIHCIGAERMRFPSGLLDGLAAVATNGRASRPDRDRRRPAARHPRAAAEPSSAGG
jgi:hypothetical protein